MLTVGIDVHDRLYAVCVLNRDGGVVKETTIRGGVEAVAGWLGGLGQPVQVCYEASLGYGVLYDALAPMAHRIVVAHPGHTRLIFASKTKNDRIDARKLAMLLLLNQVRPVHVPKLPVREWRVLIEHRRRLTDKRVAVMNALRSLLRGQGMAAPRGKKLWTAAGIQWLGAQTFRSPLTGLRRDQLLAEFQVHTAAIKAACRQLDEIARQHPGVALLRTIPGVGPRTAEAIVAYVDQPQRFGSTRRASSYFGLVPRLDETGGCKRYGHITREGPATVRKLLAEASWQVIRYSPSMRTFYHSVRQGKKSRTGVALIAVAHRLLKVMVAMLRSGEVWRKEERQPPAAAAA